MSMSICCFAPSRLTVKPRLLEVAVAQESYHASVALGFLLGLVLSLSFSHVLPLPQHVRHCYRWPFSGASGFHGVVRGSLLGCRQQNKMQSRDIRKIVASRHVLFVMGIKVAQQAIKVAFQQPISSFSHRRRLR